ncbi:MAG: ABC transporter permease subunit [Acidobacteria bacterium]|nr:ABC transporter permease subunit [Acidobacteriota bacterium]
MPIHDQGYRRYGGQRAGAGRAWAVIARAGVRTLFARRAFIGLLLLSWIPFLVRAVQIYAAANLPQAQFLAPDARMFRSFLEQQEIFLFFITVYAGTGLIANDRRANALQIYLSRPLTRLEYIFGKFAILLALLLLVTWLPAMLLLVIQVMFAGSFAFFLGNLFLVPAITIFSLIQVSAVGLAMLALSSLSKSSRYVGVLYAGLIFFSQAVYGIVRGLTRDSTMAWLSVPLDLQQIGDVVFRLEPRFHMPVWSAFVVIALLIVSSAIVLERRVRGIEVVA